MNSSRNTIPLTSNNFPLRWTYILKLSTIVTCISHHDWRIALLSKMTCNILNKNERTIKVLRLIVLYETHIEVYVKTKRNNISKNLNTDHTHISIWRQLDCLGILKKRFLIIRTGFRVLHFLRNPVNQYFNELVLGFLKTD